VYRHLALVALFIIIGLPHVDDVTQLDMPSDAAAVLQRFALFACCQGQDTVIVYSFVVFISTLQQFPFIKVLSAVIFSELTLPTAAIIANMGSRHQPIHGFAPPNFFDSAQSLHDVAVAIYPSLVFATDQFAQP